MPSRPGELVLARVASDRVVAGAADDGLDIPLDVVGAHVVGVAVVRDIVEVDRHARGALGEVRRVEAVAAREHVGPTAPGHAVVTRAAAEGLAPGAAREHVVAGPGAHRRLRAGAAGQIVAAGAAGDRVAAVPSVEEVAAAVAGQRVGVRAAVERVRALAAGEARRLRGRQPGRPGSGVSMVALSAWSSSVATIRSTPAAAHVAAFGGAVAEQPAPAVTVAVSLTVNVPVASREIVSALTSPAAAV